ncbi:MAG: T9SS type A sorting domain-containing protein [Bacteroidota bacterium]|nr:T9SS type A sorting domain-containing protein [Bacteroidota bacterium]
MIKSLCTFFCICLLPFILHSQNCDYTQLKYGVRTVKNIFIGIAPNHKGAPDSLFVDIYYPVGSPEEKKPLVIWIFGGGFFQGNRQSMDAICTRTAKQGFVAATIDYRIGFEGIDVNFAPPFAFDKAEIIRAGFRGVQDAKSAIRFLKARHRVDSIDLDRIWIGGVSAGSIVAMGSIFINQATEKPAEAGYLSPANSSARPDLGSIDGDLHLNGYDTKVQGIFNIFGALLDTNLITLDDEVALFSYHQNLDPVVPCDAKTPYWPYPLVPVNYPIAYGSCMINLRLKNLNNPANFYKTWIYNGNQHAFHNEASVLDYMVQNANPFLCGTLSETKMATSPEFSIYPNPVENVLYIKSEFNYKGIEIIDLKGNVVYKNQDANLPYINVSHFQQGLYFLRYFTTYGYKNIRFVKE